MAFELPKNREAREKAEAASRQANIRRYEQSMGVHLPYSPVAVVERMLGPGEVVTINQDARSKVLRKTKVVTIQSNVKPDGAALESNVKANVKQGFDRKVYMREYMKKARAREKKCPHCGGKL